MPVGEYCNREVTVCTPETSISKAARLMRQAHAGNLIVIEETGPGNRPIGIVTDRDLVIEVLALDIDPNVLTVGDIMSTQPVTARENEDMFDVLARMRRAGVRRVPVVDGEGILIGLITLDDMLELFHEGLDDMMWLIRNEIEHEQQERQN
ncbi:MAG: CBS domain-containing protein [Gammaproteobacteria bacterium]|nr:CBS domain-containing protein [Gammaproteobacteria bacterium]